MDTTNETNDLGAKSKLSISPVWQYFGFKADEDENAIPTCKLCLKKVSAAGGNTSNLHRHHRDHHPAKAQEVAKQTKPQQPQQCCKGNHNRQFPKHSPTCKNMNGEENSGKNSPTQ